MKRLLNILILLIPTLVFCQNDIAERQLQSYEKGNIALKENDLKVAFNFYNYAYSLKDDSNTAKLCSPKIDSLKIILRNKLLKKIIGLWKIINTDSEFIKEINSNYSLFDSYMMIADDEIYFLKYDSIQKVSVIIKKEKINFSEDKGFKKGYFEIYFEDGSQWNFDLNEQPIKNILQIEKRSQNLNDNNSQSQSFRASLQYERVVP